MRVVFAIILCTIPVIVCVTADVLIVGERVPGDCLISNRTISKPRWTFTARIRIWSIKDTIITQVKCMSLENKKAKIKIICGAVGKRYIVVKAIGKFGERLKISCQGYAIHRNAMTTTEHSIDTTLDIGNSTPDGGSSTSDKDNSTPDERTISPEENSSTPDVINITAETKLN